MSGHDHKLTVKILEDMKAPEAVVRAAAGRFGGNSSFGVDQLLRCILDFCPSAENIAWTVLMVYLRSSLLPADWLSLVALMGDYASSCFPDEIRDECLRAFDVAQHIAWNPKGPVPESPMALYDELHQKLTAAHRTQAITHVVPLEIALSVLGAAMTLREDEFSADEVRNAIATILLWVRVADPYSWQKRVDQMLVLFQDI